MFENKILGWLKRMHESYGLKVSCFCYLSGDGFCLSDTTGKFCREFSENSGWLKFGFHSSYGAYSYETAKGQEAGEDYRVFIEQMLRITGNSRCIDRIPRLHRFAGNKDSITNMQNTEFGILGLLSADDDRNSYYLTREQNQKLREQGIYVDENNQLKFFRTDIRLEHTKKIEDRMEKLREKNGPVVIFTHEWKLRERKIKSRIQRMCRYAGKQGWDFTFISSTFRESGESRSKTSQHAARH